MSTLSAKSNKNKSKKAASQASIHKDVRFLVDSDVLLQATSESAYKAGLVYFKEDRVIEDFSQQGVLYGSVEGSEPDLPYQLSIIAGPTGTLVSDCECSNKSDMLCKHAVATLLAYSKPAEDEGLYGTAKDTAIRDRIKRGQTEVRVKHLDGEPWFGRWEAQSFVSTTGRESKYQVEIRSVHERINSCTCLDLANNQLGTCKHIEAVLHQLSKLPNSQKKPTQPLPFVYKSFGEDGGIWVQRTGVPSIETAAIIDKYFDPSGRFCGQLPQDFFKFSDEIFGLDIVTICDDAKQYAANLLDKQAKMAQGQKVREQIMLSSGLLPGVDAKLYPYQLEGVAFLASNGRALLADDMGLGKTLQSIAAASYLIQKSGVRRVLVVCPASLKHQWAREIERFSGFDTQVVQGNIEKRLHQYRKDKTFFVLNYELATRDLEYINETLRPDLLILDEAQRIKNWRTKVASSIKAINSQYAFVLTGTPLENKLEELYSLMQVVDQNVLGPLWRYLSDYHIVDEKGKILGYRNLTELRQRIHHSMLRRNRSIVSDQLPGRTTVQLDVPMSRKQVALHDGAMNTAGQYAVIAQKRPLTPSESKRLMAALQQARMACDAAGLVDKETQGSPKLNELKTLIEQVCVDNGQKMVVFSQWRMMTEMVEQMLQKMKIGFAHLHGGVATDKRGKLMDKFRDDELCQVFISTDAGGSGLNLQSASVLVNLDIPWNPAVLEQRNARVHRLGQSNKVQIILMVAEDSYEQRVLQLVNNKQDLFDNVVDPEGVEDVVGVSKKALEQVMATLPTPSDGDSVQSEQSALPQAGKDLAHAPEPTRKPQVILPASLQSEDDDALKAGLLQLQQHFNNRIEQIVAKGGGLLLLLSQSTPADQTFVDSIQLGVPLALLEVQTLRQLQQLGVNPLGDDAQKIVLPETNEQPQLNPWHALAKEKFSAAKALAGQGVNGSIVDLLCSTLASALTATAKLNAIMSIENIPVWLFDTAVPQQLLSVEQAYTISRVIGLRQANIVPDTLIEQSFKDTKMLLEGLID